MVLRRAAVLAFLATACAAFGAHGAAAQSGSPAVVELRIDGVVDPFVADHVEGGIADAADAGAAAVLLTLDTPGGLDSSMRQITQAILNAEIPVIGVNQQAEYFLRRQQPRPVEIDQHLVHDGVVQRLFFPGNPHLQRAVIVERPVRLIGDPPRLHLFPIITAQRGGAAGDRRSHPGRNL